MLDRWLAIGALVAGALVSSSSHAQMDLVQPPCAPDWWDAAEVAAALDVELGPQSLRIAFVVDVPCRSGTIVSVLVEAADGRRRRSIDVGDLPAQARPRALAMGVAALLRTPAEVVPSNDGASVDERVEASSLRQPAMEEDESEGDQGDQGDERGPETRVTEFESSPTGNGRWALAVSGVALWTGSPWFGGGGSLELTLRAGWSLRAGLDGARSERDDVLGAVRGRVIVTHLGGAWRHRWAHFHLGARAGIAVEWLHLEGRSDQESVRTDSRSRWSAAGELVATFVVPLGDRIAISGDVGALVTTHGLAARSPSGRVLSLMGVSGLARLGVSVRLP